MPDCSGKNNLVSKAACPPGSTNRPQDRLIPGLGLGPTAAPGTMQSLSDREVAVGRRSLDVTNVVEVLEHWAAGRPLRAIALSLGLDRNTVRKYITPAREAGYGPGAGVPVDGLGGIRRARVPKAGHGSKQRRCLGGAGSPP
jgi:hypothetical protein